MSGLSFPELLRFNEQETSRWRQFLAKQPPEVLDLKVDLAGGGTVRDILLHMFAVELKYGALLAGGPLPKPGDLPSRTLDDIFSVATSAQGKIKNYLQSATEAELNSMITFPTLSAGEQTTSRRKVLGHALLHSLRHWAQLTTEMRRHGYKTDWHHDFLFTDALQ